jgi:hypothetical protein
VRGSLVFTRPVTSIHESDIKDWLIDWDRSLKTKTNYHGLIHGVFAYAVKRGYLAANPAIGTAPKQSRVNSRGQSCGSSPSESWRPPCGSRERTETC